MKLLLHNVLRNNSKGVVEGYPLRITASEVQVTDNEYNEEFVRHMLPTLNWGVLVEAAKSVGITTLPSSLTPALSSDSSFLRALHHVLVNVHVVSGVLTCPETGKEFAISDGIANFML
eukprot:CAMPEP_0182456000 /NCGR_PEP_ID=MMETSP1319-20130603/1985_1 /TAXON_ID=172717 /ORGANISM="Bolidomonas pacifica, Strain RCC208" /LENGTH=117 /DNA_ID=CAMNT_0024654175 /DNA_START=186 /DNA_END=535 /DNA_ORIENTATION=-